MIHNHDNKCCCVDCNRLMRTRLSAWEPVVRAARDAVEAGAMYAASDGVLGSDRDNAAGKLKAAVRALAPEHRPEEKP